MLIHCIPSHPEWMIACVKAIFTSMTHVTGVSNKVTKNDWDSSVLLFCIVFYFILHCILSYISPKYRVMGWLVLVLSLQTGKTELIPSQLCGEWARIEVTILLVFSFQLNNDAWVQCIIANHTLNLASLLFNWNENTRSMVTSILAHSPQSWDGINSVSVPLVYKYEICMWSGGYFWCRWHGCLSFTSWSNSLLHIVQHRHAARHSQPRHNVWTVSSPRLSQFYVRTWWKGINLFICIIIVSLMEINDGLIDNSTNCHYVMEMLFILHF